MTPWQMAWTHLTRSKAQSLMLLLSLAMSIAAGGLLLRIYLLTQSRFTSLAKGGDAIVAGKASGTDILLGSLNMEAENPHPLPLVLFNSLRAGQAVKFEDGTIVNTSTFIQSIIPLFYFAKYQDAKVIGTDLSFFNRPGSATLELKDGKYFSEKAINEVVVGETVAAENHLKVGDRISLRLSVMDDRKDFLVTGILQSTRSAWDRGVYATLNGAYAWLSEKAVNHPIWKTDILHYYLIYMKPEGFKPLQSLINDRTVGQLISVSEEKSKLAELTGSGGQLGLVIISFIILLTTVSVAGMMIIRYEGMRLQSAILRAMGFPINYLLKWLLGEGLALALGACLLGGLVDLILFYPLVNLLGKAVPDPSLYPSAIWLSAPIWLMATAATVLGVLLPFRRLYKVDVHTVLKGL